jgi:K+/H+ antiporter YhaU regulatory subunit KhtT
MEDEPLSNCCGAPEHHLYHGLCADCKEHAEFQTAEELEAEDCKNLLPLTDEELKTIGYALSNYRELADKTQFQASYHEQTPEQIKIRREWIAAGQTCSTLMKRVKKMQNDKHIAKLNS